MNTRRQAISIEQASRESSILSRLIGLSRESAERLALVRFLIPPELHTAIKPGPIDGSDWSLLVDNPAVASKLRQLLPRIQSHLSEHGQEITAIRIQLLGSDGP